MDLIEEVEKRLKKAFTTADLEIDFNDGQHMTIKLISADFEGMSLIDQHRKVYAAVQDLIDEGHLHAVKLITKSK